MKKMVIVFIIILNTFYIGNSIAGDIPLDEETYNSYLIKSNKRGRVILPKKYDARDEGIVSPSKIPGYCSNDCWAVASTGAMESHLLKYRYIDQSVRLSVQQMISCSPYSNGCGNGGNAMCLKFWEDYGPAHDYDFPNSYYTGNDPNSYDRCLDLDNIISSSDIFKYRVCNLHTIEKDIESFKRSLYEDGPSYFRFNLYEDFIPFYHKSEPGTVYIHNNGEARGGHAVLILGWDDDKNAFLCMNDLGPDTGPNKDGTFWISYDAHICDLSFGMVNFDIRISEDNDIIELLGGCFLSTCKN